METLKSVKLNKSITDQKDRLLEKIKQLLEEIPGSAGSSSLKISGGEGQDVNFATVFQMMHIYTYTHTHTHTHI